MVKTITTRQKKRAAFAATALFVVLVAITAIAVATRGGKAKQLPLYY